MGQTNEKKQKPPSDSTRRRPSWWTKFVRGDLSEAQKAACKSWAVWDEQADDLLNKLLEDDYKITLKHDWNNGGTLAMMTPADPKHRHNGWTLSGRGSTPVKSLKQLAYRHFVIFEGDWPMFDGTQSEEDFDD